jgi:hypothetical protein
MKKIFKIFIIGLILIQYSCGTAAWVISEKDKDFSKKLDRLFIIYSSNYGEKYNAKFTDFLKIKLTQNDVKVLKITDDELILNKESAIEKDMKKNSCAYLLTINHKSSFKIQNTLNGDSGEFLATIYNTDSKKNIWVGTINYNLGKDPEKIVNSLILEFKLNNLIKND